MSEYPELDAESLRQRSKLFVTFSAWERDRPADSNTARIFRHLGAIWRLVPSQTRQRLPDPAGVGHMHRSLRVLRSATD